MDSVQTFSRSASATGNPLVALRERRVHKVATTSPLQQISAIGGGISQLRGSAGQERLGKEGIALTNQWMIRSVAVPRQRAYVQRTVREQLDCRERSHTIDIDQVRRLFDAVFHQVD